MQGIMKRHVDRPRVPWVAAARRPYNTAGLQEFPPAPLSEGTLASLGGSSYSDTVRPPLAAPPP